MYIVESSAYPRTSLINLACAFAEENKGRAVRIDDIVTVHTGDIGTSAIIDKSLDGAQGFATLNTRVNCEIINNRYLCAFLNSTFFKRQAKKVETGDGRGNLNMKDFVKLAISFPKSLPEQKKIAEVLSSIDRSIEATEKLIAKLADLKKALMQELFTKGIGHTKFKDSPLGRIPEGWEVVKLGQVSQVKPGPFGSSIKKSMYAEKGYKIYGQEQVIAQSAYIGDYYIDESKFKELKAFEVFAGDILMSLVGTLGKVLVVPEDYEKGIINPRLVKMTFKTEIASPFFIRFLLTSEIIQNQIRCCTQGGTMGVLNGTILKGLHIILPSLSEQNQIASILSANDASIDKAKSRLNRLQDLKKGLMQDLLTGKVRVK